MATAKAVKRPLPLGQRGWKGLVRNVNRSKYMLLLVLPGALYLFVFNYVPMYGVLNAFNDLNITKGTLDSPWVGFRWFEQFFSSIYFYRLFSNTVILSFWTLVWGFPMPILFALLLNEVKNQFFKRTVQSISYFPHFISVVVVVGIMYNMFSSSGGIFYNLVVWLTGNDSQILGNAEWFRPLYVGSDVWQNFGWNSIIFLGALSSVDPQLYEAARIDGANRYRMMMSITLPSIMPTVVTMLILNIGGILSVGADKVILLYNPAIYETSDVIGTYIYRDGILGANYSFSTAIGLFTSVIGFVMLTITNQISKKVNEVSLW
ncbi:MAG: ABC transporter permease subunit [Spirochaetales bacterium]